jgi:hypothetical protein
VTITQLDMTFERTGATPDVTFILQSDTIQVFNYEQGQNTAELRIQVDLGSDFMSEYTNSSTEKSQSLRQSTTQVTDLKSTS